MGEKLKVAVLVGGLSAEHDVSVCTGLEVLQALDPDKYDAFPVYVGLDNQWWVGDKLRDIKTYIPDLAAKRELTRVSLNVGDARSGGSCVLREVGAPFWRKGKSFAVDVVLPALHGTWGEDGTLQGALTAVDVAYTGGDTGAMAAAMNKSWTMMLASLGGVPVVPSLLVRRGENVDMKEVAKKLGKFPLFVKPNFLGSSIGARVVKDEDELQAGLADVFRLDTMALIQKCVPNLVEYNLAVRRLPNGEIVTSAIERPLRKGEILSFADKYAGSGANKLGNKVKPGAVEGGGMAFMDRVLNPPELSKKDDGQIRAWAHEVFDVLNMAGTPRLDFMCDGKTGEIWFNEINPIPGGISYFLWEAAEPRLGFSELLEGMIDEALRRAKTRGRTVDPVGSGSAIFHKRG
ncbi:MAG: D-alanine--D-alanine ligase [Proteobacteria bacterium]|nr:D-alanine--D-alanine ligase [Pseudomonadota bacterium]